MYNVYILRGVWNVYQLCFAMHDNKLPFWILWIIIIFCLYCIYFVSIFFNMDAPIVLCAAVLKAISK